MNIIINKSFCNTFSLSLLIDFFSSYVSKVLFFQLRNYHVCAVSICLINFVSFTAQWVFVREPNTRPTVVYAGCRNWESPSSSSRRTPGLSIPWCCLPISSSVCLVFFPLSLCLARCFWPDLTNGRWPYHCSLGLFTMVRRSSCGLIACWILAQTSSSVTWSLYEMRIDWDSVP